MVLREVHLAEEVSTSDPLQFSDSDRMAALLFPSRSGGVELCGNDTAVMVSIVL